MRPDLPMVSCNDTSNSFSDFVLVNVNWPALNFSLLLIHVTCTFIRSVDYLEEFHSTISNRMLLHFSLIV